MNRAILIHGFADDNGRNTTDLLRPFFEAKSFIVSEYDYGWTGLLGVRFLNPSRAAQLANKIGLGDVGVGHSNGCALLQKASLLGAPFSQLVFINPALDADAEIGPQVKRIHVWHSPSDLPVRFAGLFIRHPWGEMGSTGYKGADPRFTNYNKENDYSVSSHSHLDLFLFKEKLDFFGPLIVDAVIKSANV